MGDIFTIYELEHGANFNTALRALAEQLGTSVEPHSTKPARKCPPAPSPVQSGSAPKDLSDYFAACRARLYDPAVIAYLTERGISPETAVAYGLGFDPKAARQEVTAAARELSSRQTVSTTSHAVSTRMHNRGAGR